MTFSTFDGLNPVFVTGDLDIIKEIAIKKFDCFMNHRVCMTAYASGKARRAIDFSEYASTIH